MTSPPASSPRFDDGKEPGALRTIGEVADALGIRQHVLRYWEQHFPALQPLKRSGGRRYYRPEDVALVARIDRLINAEGYTLKGARGVIESGAGSAPAPAQAGEAVALAQGAATVAPDGEAERELLAKLRDIRKRLAGALEEA